MFSLLSSHGRSLFQAPRHGRENPAVWDSRARTTSVPYCGLHHAKKPTKGPKCTGMGRYFSCSPDAPIPPLETEEANQPWAGSPVQPVHLHPHISPPARPSGHCTLPPLEPVLASSQPVPGRRALVTTRVTLSRRSGPGILLLATCCLFHPQLFSPSTLPIAVPFGRRKTVRK